MSASSPACGCKPGNFGVAPTGPARPAVQFRDTDFWAHGLNVGLGLRF